MAYLRFVDTVIPSCQPFTQVIVDRSRNEAQNRGDETSNLKQSNLPDTEIIRRSSKNQSPHRSQNNQPRSRQPIGNERIQHLRKQQHGKRSDNNLEKIIWRLNSSPQAKFLPFGPWAFVGTMLVGQSAFELCGCLFDVTVVGVLSAYDFDFFDFGFEFFRVVYGAEIDVEICGAFVAGFGAEEVQKWDVDSEEDCSWLLVEEESKGGNLVCRSIASRGLGSRIQTQYQMRRHR